MRRFNTDPPDVRAILIRLVESGVRRAEIAAAAGVDTDTIGRYIDGSRSPNWPRGWAIARFAESRRML